MLHSQIYILGKQLRHFFNGKDLKKKLGKNKEKHA
jgi:hypothetical protein